MTAVAQIVSATLTSAPWTKWVASGSGSGSSWVLGTVTTLATLSVKGGTITLDEGWAPYGRAEIRIKLPDQATLDLIDPRSNTPAAAKRIVVTATRAGVTRTFDLLIIDRQADYAAGELVIVAATDEAILQQRQYTIIDPSLTPRFAYAGDPIDPAIVANVFAVAGLISDDARSWLNTTYPLDVVATGTWAVDDQLAYTPGDEIWDAIAAALLPAQLRLFCDEARDWHLVPAVFNRPGGAYLRWDTNITGASDEISTDSDAWSDGVLVHYTWQVYSSAAGSWSSMEDYDYYSPNPGAGLYVYATPATHGVTVEVTGRKTTTTSAKAIWSRRAGRGRSTSVASTASIGATPGQAFTALTSPTALAQIGRVGSVVFDLETDEITVVGRDLITAASSRAWLVQTPGVRWIDIPAGVAWTAYTNH